MLPFNGFSSISKTLIEAIPFYNYCMSRSQPYRPRIPTHIIQLLDVASRITLFLVGQSGPLCFTFKDRLQNKYKTSIGPQLKCSCAPNRNDHCIHTAYVFLKIFRVSVDNPIIWQAAYVDSELQDLVTWKHTMPEARRPRPVFDIASLQVPSELPSDWIKKKEKVQFKAVVTSERMKLQQDSVCPICQEAMTKEMSLTFCMVKCGNNFHLQCLKIWARHRIQEEAGVSCPMCRCKFPGTVMQELEQEEKLWARQESEKIKIQFNCSSCGLKNIPKNPHKCVLCTGFQLCECCYAANKHIKHPFIRRDDDGRWRGAEQRREDELKIKNFIDSKRKQTYNDQILKKLRKIDEDPNKLIDYIASAYPYVSRYITEKIDPLKKLDFDPTDIRCLKCGSTRMLFLRRLACGHFIDHECLKDCIIKQKFYCTEDGSQILKGYQNLRQKQKQVDSKKQHQLIQLSSPQFDPSPLEHQQSVGSEYNFVGMSQEPTLTQILSSRPSRNVQEGNRVDQIFSSHIIREERSNSRQRRKQERQQNMGSQISQPPPRNIMKSRDRPPIPKPSEIRIRNVANSSNKQIKQQRNSSVREKPSNNRKRQEMKYMFEALIGRKLN